MSEHSILPPSSAARRMACPGSLRLEKEYGRKVDSEEATEGTFAHIVAAELLKFSIGKGLNVIYTKSEVDVHAYSYVDLILKISKGYKNIHVEEKTPIKSIHEDCFGTPDAWFFNENELHIFDFKYGFMPVTPHENWQLISYASGIIDLLKIENNIEVIMHIYQPRNFVDGAHKNWKISYFELKSYFAKLRLNEQLALTDNAPLKPSFECTYCTAKHKCPVLQRSVVALSNYENLENKNFTKNEGLSSEIDYLRNLKNLIDARLLGLEEEALHLLKGGKNIPGYTLDSVNTREKWNAPIEDIVEMAELLNIDIKKPIELITPKQAINKGLPADLVKSFSIKPPGALKLKKIKEEEIKEIFNKSY